MRLDRKLLLIAPTVVLLFVVAGLVYAAMQLGVLNAVGNNWQDRRDFIVAVERGEKPLDRDKAIGLLRLSLDVEVKRSAAIAASRDLLIELSAIGLVACIALGVGIRGVPRQHWPRVSFSRSQPE